MNVIQQGNDAAQEDFEGYLQEKLAHLKGEDHHILEVVLRQYKHLFYGLGAKNWDVPVKLNIVQRQGMRGP